ncbi:MAG: hypothetical protein KKE17_00580 [Proteobacteria bacterium]|nr:hypothetical protein [Pseudomonadota bacterium]MBU1708477.1 hypothetical protein [Pseudomonadota bacterium]
MEKFKGWMIRDTFNHRICAGGLRIQPGLTKDKLIEMARNMTLKMRVNKIRVDGAKCGIDYDPTAIGKSAALNRFMKAISPYIKSDYSMGPDLNVEMQELETIANKLGLSSVKIAIAAAQGWDHSYFLERSKILNCPINNRTLGTLRAGYGLAAATLAVLDILHLDLPEARIAVQGFGTIAKAAASAISAKGGKIIAFSDLNRCIQSINNKGLNLEKLLQTKGTLLPEPPSLDVLESDKDGIFNLSCDVFILAAVEQAVTLKNAHKLQVRAIIPGANLAISAEADTFLSERGILVIPDFIAGSGGSVSMEGLYGPEEHPTAQQVLDHIDHKIKGLVQLVILTSRNNKITPTQAALRLCAENIYDPDARPYSIP